MAANHLICHSQEDLDPYLYAHSTRRKGGTLSVAERKKPVTEYINEDYADSKDTGYIKETYEECLAEDDIENIYIKSSTIVFYKEYCFPHAARPYDTDLDVEISLKELSPLLTSYGKAILNVR